MNEAEVGTDGQRGRVHVPSAYVMRLTPYE